MMKKCKHWRCRTDCWNNEGKCKSSCCHNGDCHACANSLITYEYDEDVGETFLFVTCMLYGLDTEETAL